MDQTVDKYLKNKKDRYGWLMIVKTPVNNVTYRF